MGKAWDLFKFFCLRDAGDGEWHGYDLFYWLRR